MSGVRAGYVGALHYLATGTDDHAFVLLHETPLSARSFAPLLARLAGRSVRAVAFDTPGYGCSAPAGTATIENYAAEIEGGIRALGLSRVVICGVHTGAAIAIEIAARCADGRCRARQAEGLSGGR